MKMQALPYFRLALAAAVVCVGLGYLGWLHPAFDTVAQFRLHLSVVLIVAFFFRGFMGNRLAALGYLLAGAIGFWGATSGIPFSAQASAPVADKPVHTMVHFNLFWLNERKENLIKRVHEIDPLFISLTETAASWMPTLKRIQERWPHVAHCPEYDVRGGIMLFSKFPMDSGNDFCGSYGSFMKTTVILEDNTTLDLGAIHPRWPWPASGPKQYESYIPVLEGLGQHALIAGDFNSTTWSWAVQRFANSGNLKIVQGIGSTWFFGTSPASLIRIFGLPIDNVMHKGRVSVLSAQTLESWGSDHLPVLIRFQIR